MNTYRIRRRGTGRGHYYLLEPWRGSQAMDDERPVCGRNIPYSDTISQPSGEPWTLCNDCIRRRGMSKHPGAG